MRITKIFFLLVLSILLWSCQGDSDPINLGPGKYETGGVFVSCQGIFNASSGTITHYDPNTSTATQEIFKTANAGVELGNVVQSLNILFPKAYIIVNNANKMVVARSSDFVIERNIEGFNQPRFTNEVMPGKLYISEWGSDGLSGKVKVFNTNSQEITGEIALRNGPERMITKGDKVYVCNSGGFDRDSVVHVIDGITDIHTGDIIVGDNPVSIVQDKNGSLWVLCRGYLDWVDPSNNTLGRLIRIENDQITASFGVPNGADNLSISPTGDLLFFTAEGKIFKHDITASQFLQEFIVESSFYGLSINPETGHLYAADAKDFSSKGEVIIYDQNGTQLGSFETGVIPQDIHFE